MKESQAALLQRAEELTEQLKQERQRALELEGHLTTSNLSLQTLDKVHIQARLTRLKYISRFRTLLFFSYKRGSQTWKEKGI